MKRTLFTLVIGAGLAMGTPAISAAQQEDLGAGAEGDVDASTEIICKREPAPTGSRIGARNVCKTQMEWDRIAREARDALEDAGNRNRMLNEEARSNCGIMNTGC